MKMSLASYKKIHEDNHSATFKHEKGHEIKVAKKGLSPKLQKDLQSIPVHMADGGGLEIEPVNPDPVEFSPVSQVASSSLSTPQAPTPEPTPPVQNKPELATSSPTPAGIPGALSSGDYQKQYEDYNKSLLKQGDIAAKQAEMQAAAQNQHIENMKRLQSDYQNNVKELNGHVDTFMKDIENQHFDSGQYMKNMSGGQKISTAIGLILGGIGGALTHQENPAMKFLQSQIDRNIEEQKLNFGKKKTILEANYQKFGNMNDAIKMTTAMEGAMVAAQLQKAAAQNGSQAAKNNAQMASSQFLTSTVYPSLQTVAMKQSLAQGAQNGTIDPAQYVKYVVPEPHQKQVFGEIERAQNTRHMSGNILEAFENAAKEVRPMSGGKVRNLIPGVTSPWVGALHQHMQPTFQDLEGTVRQAAMDNTFKNITPQAFDNDATIEVKRNAVKEYLRSKASAPTAKGFGIDLDKFPSTSTNPEMSLNPQQQQYLQWARSNPSDPRAQAVFQKLGVK